MGTIPLETLWDEFARHGIKPMVLRDFEALPVSVRSDLDLALRHPADLPRAQQAIAAFAGKIGAEVVRVVRRSYVTQVKLLLATVPAQLVLDLHAEGEGWRGPLYLTTEALFASATEREGWFEPSRAHQAMMALFQHLLWGGFYKKKYHDLLPRWIAGEEAAFSQAVADAFGPQWGERIVSLIQSRDVRTLERSVWNLRGCLWRTRGLPDLCGSLSRLFRFVGAEIRITLERQGRWIVLVGPDGVGKTSIAGGLAAETAPFFRGFRYHHWVPAWWKPLLSDVPPGGGRFERGVVPSGWLGRLGSLARMGRNGVRAWLWYARAVLPSIYRQRLVLGDRYLFNYLIAPQSVRYGASGRWVRWALRLVPRPDLVISLTGEPETIHRRKAELTPGEIAACQARARALEGLGYSFVEISTDAPLETVTAQVAMAVIRTLER